MGIRIEQFIYTNVNQRGRSIKYSTIDFQSLENNFQKIMELFKQIPPSLNIVFFKLNKDFYVYGQCKEYGFERIGKEKKKGRKADIFIGLLIPIKLVEKLNYDFSLAHLLLSNKINWENILNVIEENSTLESLDIELNTDELTKKVINYVKDNSSNENISFVKQKFKTNFKKIISNSDIISLMNYSLALPKDIGKDIIFSTLDIYFNVENDDISVTREIPTNLYYQQVSFLDNMNKESYQILKKYPIRKKDIISKKKDDLKLNKSNVPRNEKSIKSIKLKNILKMSLYFFSFLLLLITIIPFYQYYKLASTYTKDITLENLKTYRELINHNGFLLNSFTNIANKYQSDRDEFFIRNRNNILAFTYCDSNKLKFTKDIIDEYKKDKDIKSLEKKYLNLTICMLSIKIENDKKNIFPFLDFKNLILKKELDNKENILTKLKKLILNIKKYRALRKYTSVKYYNDAIVYNIIYEKSYFRPIKKALNTEEINDILELIQEYEKHTLLFFYKKDIQKIKFLLKKKEVKIEIRIFSKKNKYVDIKYLNIKNKEISQKIKTNDFYTLYLAWNEDAYIKIKDIYVLRGRLLNSLDKEFTEKSLISFIKKDSFRVHITSFGKLELFDLNERNLRKYIK